MNKFAMYTGFTEKLAEPLPQTYHDKYLKHFEDRHDHLFMGGKASSNDIYAGAQKASRDAYDEIRNTKSQGPLHADSETHISKLMSKVYQGHGAFEDGVTSGMDKSHNRLEAKHKAKNPIHRLLSGRKHNKNLASIYENGRSQIDNHRMLLEEHLNRKYSK